MKLAEKKVVVRVVGKFCLIEHFAVQLKARNAPIDAYECKQERPVRALGQGSRPGKIRIVTDVAAPHRLNADDRSETEEAKSAQYRFHEKTINCRLNAPGMM